MIIADDILKPYLEKLNPPEGCPTLDVHSWLEFARGRDLYGGYTETEDYSGVTCRRHSFVSNSEIIHPSCRSCEIAGTTICDMKVYRRQLGFKD